MSAPCPFCGCEEQPTPVWSRETFRHETVRMVCPECEAGGPIVEIKRRADDETARQAADAALALWEKRA